MRLARPVVIPTLLLLFATGCSSQSPALAPTEDALAATQSAILALELKSDGSNLGTVTDTTLDDMLAAVADSEASLAELPRSTDVEAALIAVRQASDAIGTAIDDKQPTDATAALQAASDALAATVDELAAAR